MQQALTNALLMDAVVGCLQSSKAIYAASKLAQFDRIKMEGRVLLIKMIFILLGLLFLIFFLFVYGIFFFFPFLYLRSHYRYVNYFSLVCLKFQ